MASYDKIVKYVVERFQDALSPLDKMVENQERIIRQNAEIHAILNKMYQRSIINTDENLTRPDELGN